MSEMKDRELPYDPVEWEQRLKRAREARAQALAEREPVGDDVLTRQVPEEELSDPAPLVLQKRRVAAPTAVVRPNGDALTAREHASPRRRRRRLGSAAGLLLGLIAGGVATAALMFSPPAFLSDDQALAPLESPTEHVQTNLPAPADDSSSAPPLRAMAADGEAQTLEPRAGLSAPPARKVDRRPVDQANQTVELAPDARTGNVFYPAVDATLAERGTLVIHAPRGVDDEALAAVTAGLACPGFV